MHKTKLTLLTSLIALTLLSTTMLAENAPGNKSQADQQSKNELKAFKDFVSRINVNNSSISVTKRRQKTVRFNFKQATEFLKILKTAKVKQEPFMIDMLADTVVKIQGPVFSLELYIYPKTIIVGKSQKYQIKSPKLKALIDKVLNSKK